MPNLCGRWTSWSALSLLVTLIGGTVLALVSIRRSGTSAAFSSFTKHYGYDAEVFSSDQAFTKGYFNIPYVTKVTKDACTTETATARRVGSSYLTQVSQHRESPDTCTFPTTLKIVVRSPRRRECTTSSSASPCNSSSDLPSARS